MALLEDNGNKKGPTKGPSLPSVTPHKELFMRKMYKVSRQMKGAVVKVNMDHTSRQPGEQSYL